MIKKEEILSIVSDKLNQDDVFIVELKVSTSNSILLYLDSDEGVDIKYCTEISKLIENTLDREVEDFELEVSSAGLSQPFKVLRQYEKNLGSEVKVFFNDGKSISGLLKDVDEQGVVLETSAMEKVEGKKRKVEVIRDQEFSFDEMLKTELVIKFK